MQSGKVIFAVMLAMVPLGAKGADLVVWWPAGYYAEEDVAIRETIAAFEQDSGKEVEVVLYSDQELLDRIAAGLKGGELPDFVFGFWRPNYIQRWALEDRLVDLSDNIGSFSNLFDPIQLDRAMQLNEKTGQKALYGLPVGQISSYIHVWKSLLERAGLTLADIPKEWDAFWSFWCDRVQPAVREALGRDDIWGIGRPMSGEANDTTFQFFQFVYAYDADYVTPDGKFVIDDPQIRRRLVSAIDGCTAVYRKGCTPPDSVTWDDRGNNQAFLAQTIVMTTNNTLSIPDALKLELRKTITRTARRSNGHLVHLARPSRSKGTAFRRWSSRTAATSAPLKNSSASSWPVVG
jgi:multiple sugar transport system substrate-binding protein